MRQKLVVVFLAMTMLLFLNIVPSMAQEGLTTIYSLNVQTNVDRDTQQRWRVYEKIKEEAAIDLQLIMASEGELTQKANLMLAAKEKLDIIPCLPIASGISLYNQGAVYTFTDEVLERYPNLKAAASEEAWSAVKMGDVYIGVPLQGAQVIPSLLQVRTDWLEKLGISMPETMEAYEEMLQLFSESDLDGNGKNDTIPLIANVVSELEQALLPFFTQGGAYWWYDEADGLLKPYEMDPGYADYLKTVVRWQENGWLFNEIATTSKQDKLSYVASNRVGAVAGTWTRFLYNGIELLVKSNPEASFGFCVPKDGSATAANAYSASQYAKAVTLITSSCSNPEACLALLDWQCSKEGQLLTTYGIEGENYTVNEETDKFVIVSDTPDDWNSAQYYLLYNLHEGFGPWRTDLWPLDTFTYNLMNEMNQVIKDTIPQMIPDDALVAYDVNKFEAYNRMNDLQTFLDEAKAEIMAGSMEAEEWDAIMEQWLKMGGQQLMQDKTKQYLAWISVKN